MDCIAVPGRHKKAKTQNLVRATVSYELGLTNAWEFGTYEKSKLISAAIRHPALVIVNA